MGSPRTALFLFVIHSQYLQNGIETGESVSVNLYDSRSYTWVP